MRYILAFLLLCQLAFATAYTVKSSGGSFTTFTACAAAAVGGDTCTAFASASPQTGWVQPTSGSAGNPIIFTKNVGDTVTITSTVTLSGRSYITLNGGLAFSGANAIVGNSSTQHVIIDGNTFTGNGAFRIPDNAGSGGSDNVFSNNTVTRNGGVAGGSTTVSSLYLFGDRNRIDTNDFGGGSSDAIEAGGQNLVIRGNTFHDIDGTTSGEHIDFVQGIGSTLPALAFSLIESNVEKNCVNQCHFVQLRGGGSAIDDTVITRFNYVQNIDSLFAGYGDHSDGAATVPNGWVYNNTSATEAKRVENGDGAGFDSGFGTAINNIFYNTEAGSWSPTIYTQGGFGNGNLTFTTAYSGTWNSPYSSEATYAALRNQNPLFASYPTNGTLQSGSPARNVGVKLTSAVGSGSSSTALTVSDSHGLQPGWAGATGDWIRIGAATTRQISSINYSTNVITLAASATWANADPIYLYKNSSGIIVLNGASPDLGAFPFGLTTVAYFVKNGGNNALAGTSDATAWATIAKVNGFTFNPGDTIQFKKGSTWNLATDAALSASSSGTAGNPITYTAYGSGALPILDGQGTVAVGFTASSKNYITVDSLQIQNNSNTNAVFATCNTCNLTNSTLSSAATHGVNVTGASPNFTATGNTYSTSATFSMSGKAFNIASTSASVSTISSNTIDLSQVLNTKNVSGIVCSASIIGCVVTNNLITMAQGVQGIGIKTVSASSHTTGGQVVGNSIVGLTNVCTGCDGEAIELTGDATHQVTNTLVNGNYVKNGSASADSIGLFWATGNTVTYNFCIGNGGQNAAIHLTTGSNNNFLYGNSTYGSNYGIELIAVTGNDVQNNVVAGHQRGIGFFTGATGTYSYNISFNNSIANYVSGTDSGHNLTSDPKWTSSTPAAPEDFKLQSTSPAIRSGANLGTTYQISNDPAASTFPFAPGNQYTFGPTWARGALLYFGPNPPARRKAIYF